MAVSITTQSQFQAAVRLVHSENKDAKRKHGFCYLCGNKLPKLGTANRSTQVMSEHVIPKAVCGDPPSHTPDAWRPVLDVHRKCDAIHKRDQDDFYSNFQHAMGTDPQMWNNKKVQIVSKHLGEIRMLSNGKSIGTVTGMDNVFRAIENWIRGLHALMFSNYLPVYKFCNIASPVDAFSDKLNTSIEDQAKMLTQVRSICAKQCLYAEALGKLHRLRCWGGRIEFVCCWSDIKISKFGAVGKWPLCFWLLNVPGLNEWTHAQRGESIPWAGMYSVPWIPESCAPISFEEFADFDLYNSFKLPNSLTRIMPSLFANRDYYRYY